MVCCALLAGLIGLVLTMLAPWRLWRPSPFAWRPGVEAAAGKRFSLAARLRSFRYAFAGFAFLVRNEHNARIHLGIAAAVVLAGLWFRIGLDDWRWILAAIALVLAAEAINTAIEQLCDVVSTEHVPGIGHAKDVASCAVLFASMGAVAIGAATFYPYLTDGAGWAGPFAGVFCGAAH